jgi:sirohydrochlorin ferrochelatase
VDSSTVLVADCKDETALAIDERTEAAELALAESVVVEATGTSTAVVFTATEALEKMLESCKTADALALSVVVEAGASDVVNAGTSEEVATSVGRTLEEVKSVMTAGVVVVLYMLDTATDAADEIDA